MMGIGFLDSIKAAKAVFVREPASNIDPTQPATQLIDFVWKD